jgi:CBS domain containing-hemolysin-like protein
MAKWTFGLWYNGHEGDDRMRVLNRKSTMKVILTIIVVGINIHIVSNIILGTFSVIDRFYLWSDILYGINYFSTFYTLAMFIVLFFIKRDILHKRLMIVNIISFLLLIASLILFFYRYAQVMSSF